MTILDVTPPRSLEALRCGTPIDPRDFADLRRRLVLDHCKWDPQVGDVSTLAPFPLILSRATWRQLARDAEALAAETTAAEPHLLHSPALQRTLGVPRRLRRVLRANSARSLPGEAALAAGFPRSTTCTPTRVMRFDFHPTPDGWRVSEVNSDVPGGYCEASSFTAMVADHVPGAIPTGDPGGALAQSLANNTAGPIALLSAPGFMEDQQVTAYLATRLRALGREALLVGPRQLAWRDGRAHVLTDGAARQAGAIVRFFQAEWLTHLPRSTAWPNLLAGGFTPLSNPAASLLTESKRFPLTWDALPVPMPNWRRLLPETRDPRDAPWRTDDAWLLKSAYCNTGDTVTIRGLAAEKTWRAAARSATWFPRGWVAQRRFDTLPLDSPAGSVYPCVGVYVIDGRAAGAYGRLSPTPVIDFAATDVAVLVDDDDDEKEGHDAQG
jgi:glutathionylspermidine synthase